MWRLLTSIAVSTTSTAVGRGPIGSATAVPWGTPPKASTATEATTSATTTTTTNCNNASLTQLTKAWSRVEMHRAVGLFYLMYMTRD